MIFLLGMYRQTFVTIVNNLSQNNEDDGVCGMQVYLLAAINVTIDVFAHLC